MVIRLNTVFEIFISCTLGGMDPGGGVVTGGNCGKGVRSFVRLSLLTMTNPNQLCDVLLFVCSKMADETNLSSKLPVADRTREV